MYFNQVARFSGQSSCTKFVRSFGGGQHTCPVGSFNEWDPLEEVIVGRVEGACVPPLTTEVQAAKPPNKYNFYKEYGGKHFPADAAQKASLEVENLCRILEREGVVVRRPEACNFKEDFKTPDFHSPVGLYNAMPR